jgi:hypothetical protein
MAAINGFTYHDWPMKVIMNNETQQKFVNSVQRLSKPFLLVKHFYYVEFPRDADVIYINLVRDPLELVISQYYFRQVKGLPGYKHSLNECIEENLCVCKNRSFLVLVPYFCGQNPVCKLNSYQALKLAKYNIYHHYAVIGVLEDFQSYIGALQCMFPTFFNKIIEVYSTFRHLNVNSRKEYVSQKNMKEIANRIRFDYELYNYIKERFVLLKMQLNADCKL